MRIGSRKARALHTAVAAIYLDDSSDYRSALWDVIKELDPYIYELLANNEKRAFKLSRRLAGEKD